MDLRDIKRIATDVGLVASICPVNLHVDIKYDDLDEESITFLVATKDGFVKDDSGEVIAKTEQDLFTWLDQKTN